MARTTFNECAELWAQLAAANRQFEQAHYELFQKCKSCLVDLVRVALQDPRQTQLAFRIASHLEIEQRKELLRDFIAVARYQCAEIVLAREAILGLPHDWLLQNIEAAAEDFLSAGDDEVYQRLLELYVQIDKSLTLRLAHRAAQHPDPHVQEAGEDFLEILGKK